MFVFEVIETEGRGKSAEEEGEEEKSVLLAFKVRGFERRGMLAGGGEEDGMEEGGEGMGG